jgi:hypothetical protein
MVLPHMVISSRQPHVDHLLSMEAEQVILQFLDNSTRLKGSQGLYAVIGSLVCGRSLGP